MSSGFGLPVLNLQSALGGLGTTYQDSFDKAQKKTALSKLGEQIQGGDYAGAASTAFNAGDAGTAIGLLKLGAEQKKEARQNANSLTVFGPGGLPGLYPGGDDAGLGPVGSGPRADASPASRALPSFADSSGPSGGYVENLFKRESGNNPTAQASTSSARGLGQFTDATWNGVARKYPNLGLTPVGNGQDGRTDPDQMLRATKALTADNEQVLSRANLPVNDATRYAVHFLGAGGGPRFVAATLANPDRPATSVVSPDQVSANRGVFFDRSGRPKTAGEVMGDFQKSFSGGGRGAPRPASQQVAYADNEEQTQALERQMGMLPQTQTAAYDPRADLPAADMQEAGFRIPGEEPIAPDVGAQRLVQRPTLPSSDPNARNASPGILPTSSSPSATMGQQPAIPALGGSVPRGRTMTLPGPDGPPVQIAENTVGRGAVVNDGGEVGAFQRRLSGMNPNAKVSILLRASAMDLPEQQRGVVKSLLDNALQEARMPDNVREFLWARNNGLTQAKTPGEYSREAKGPTTLAPGSSVLAPDGKTIALTAPDRERENKVSADIEARKAGAADLGLQPGSPAYQSFVLTGKMLREDQQPLTASDKKAILEADDAVVSAETAIGNLKAAKDLSAKAYAGPLASWRGWATGAVGSEAGQATQELDNLVTTNALGQLKAIFGAAPTEGERKILLDIQGSSNLPHALRVKIYDRGVALAERRLDMNRDRAAELRGQTYYKPGSGPQGAGADARPPAASSNRAGSRQDAVAAPPAGAIDLLRSNPALSDAFDQKYGPGSAARVFGGR